MYFPLSLLLRHAEDTRFNFLHVQERIPPVTPTEVVGVVRGSEKPSIFVPENNPSSGQWFYIDVPAIARACGLPDNTVYVEDINDNVSSGCPYPVPKDVNNLIRSSVMPQDHLNYTLTWYALLIYIYSRFQGKVSSDIGISFNSLFPCFCCRYSLSAAVTFMAFKRLRPKKRLR